MLNLTAALAPVLCLLGLLMLMDSFKLVPIRFVLQALAGGARGRARRAGASSRR